MYDTATERRREFIKQADAREVHFVDTRRWKSFMRLQKAQQVAATDVDEMTARDLDSARRTAKELKPKIGVTQATKHADFLLTHLLSQNISAGGLQKPRTYRQPEEYESEAGAKEYEKERKNMFSDK